MRLINALMRSFMLFSRESIFIPCYMGIYPINLCNYFENQLCNINEAELVTLVQPKFRNQRLLIYFFYLMCLQKIHFLNILVFPLDLLFLP